MPEHVEDDLYGLNVRISNRLECFLDPFHAYAIVANLARASDIIQRVENFGT